METLENIARRVAQRDGTPVRAAHRAGCRRQGSQQPVDLGRFQAHVDLDGGAARDRCRHGPANIVERGAAQLPLGNLQNFEQHLFDLGRGHAGRRRLSPPPCGCRTARSRIPARPAPRRCARIRSAARRSGRSPGAPAAAGSRCRRWRAAANTCSNRIRSCATCWSMIHNPSRPAAMMKLSWIWPSGRRSVSASRLSGLSGCSVGEQRSMSVGNRELRALPKPAEPGRSRIAARAKAAGEERIPEVPPDRSRRRCRCADGREVHALDALAEFGIRQPGSGLRRRGRGNIRRRTLGHQNLANGIADEIVDHRSVPESHFGLGRMHVHVDFFGVAIQKQQREGITGRRHQVVIRGRNRVQQQAVAYQAAVDEQDKSNCGCISAPADR